MKVEESLSPKELAKRSKEYDRVFTVEASLANSINSYLSSKKVYTPLEVVDADENFRRKYYLKVVQETDLTWRQASYLLNNILSCWKNTGKLEKITKYPKFDNEDVSQIIEILSNETDHPFNRLSKKKINSDNVAVIKEHQFTEIDKKVLPDKYQTIEVFQDSKTDLNDFNIFKSTSDIAQSIIESIKDYNPSEIGIVVKPGTKYGPVIKSFLETEDIPYSKTKHVKEKEEIRTFLSLIEVGLSNRNVKVKDIRPIIQEINVQIPNKLDNKKLEKLNEGREFKELLNVVKHLKFDQVLQKYEKLINRDTGFQQILEELGLEDKQVNQRDLNSIKHFLNNFEINSKERDKGVLIADPTKVSNVDRKIVFHVGMDTEWMREVKDKPWINKEQRETSNLKDFKSLIKSGKSYYMVQDKELNQKIRPCFYLNEIIDREFNSFTELPNKAVKPKRRPHDSGFRKEDKFSNVEIEEKESLSQSSLNKLVQSPRLYYLNKLISEADQEKFTKGRLFHMYAEYHFNNPEKASATPLEEITELMMEEIDEYADEIDLEDLRTQFKLGIENIREFLNEINAQNELELNYYETTTQKNIFTENLDGKNNSCQTEAKIKNPENSIKGQIDLVVDKQKLVDYKSGRKKSRKKAVKKSHPRLHEDEKYPDFQPLLYIAHHTNEAPRKEIEFNYCHFLNDIGETITGKEADHVTKIKYYPLTFQRKIRTLEVFNKLKSNVSKSNDRRKTLEKLGYEKYKQFTSNNKLQDPFSKEEALDSNFKENLLEFCKKEVGDYKYVEKGVDKTVKKLVEFRLQNYFKEDITEINEFLEQKKDELNEYLHDSFPLKKDPEKLPQRDLIVK